MAKITSGKKATVRGSGESKRAVAHSQSASSPGVSKAGVKTSSTQGVKRDVKRKTAAASAVNVVSAASARTAKVVRPSTKKALEQASRQAKEQANERASAKEAAAIAGRKRNTKQGSEQ
jgi:RNA polymerase primary sigma factor